MTAETAHQAASEVCDRTWLAACLAEYGVAGWLAELILLDADQYAARVVEQCYRPYPVPGGVKAR